MNTQQLDMTAVIAAAVDVAVRNGATGTRSAIAAMITPVLTAGVAEAMRQVGIHQRVELTSVLDMMESIRSIPETKHPV